MRVHPKSTSCVKVHLEILHYHHDTSAVKLSRGSLHPNQRTAYCMSRDDPLVGLGKEIVVISSAIAVACDRSLLRSSEFNRFHIGISAATPFSP